MNTNELVITQETTSVFSNEERKTAENMLTILAYISVDYWVEAILSDRFIVNGILHDYTTGYKNRVVRIEEDPNAEPISAKQIQVFRNKYLELAKEEIYRYLNNDIAVANLLKQKDRVVIPLGKDCSSISFGGWDNDPDYMTAKAMKEAGIQGKMNGGYTKTRITLLAESGTIHVGWFKYKPVLYTFSS